MQKLTVVLICLISFFAIKAQTPKDAANRHKAPAIGHLFGKLIESKTKEEVPFASVTLYWKDSLINGVLSKINGEFSLENIPDGKFTLKISFIGYKTIQQDVSVVPQNEEQDLGNIKLDPDQTTLKDVEITAEKSLVEIGIDRKIFNVDKNIVSKGGTAADVMKNIPSVTFDENGNPKLRQNNTTVYIDGRPISLTLDQIPADQIEKVEIITNPSAKFEASVTGGIINIVMKNNIKKGYNGIISLGAGTNDHYNGMTSLNIKQKSVGISASYNYNTFENPIKAYNNRTDLLNGNATGYYYSNNNKVFRNTFNNGSLNFNFYINNRNTISFNNNFTTGYFNTQESQTSRTLNGNDSLLSTGTRSVSQVTNFYNVTPKLHWRKRFPKKEKEWSVDLNYNFSQGKNPNEYVTTTYDGNGNLITNNPIYQTNLGHRDNKTYTFQTDYTNPLNDSTKIEWGARANYQPLLQSIDASYSNANSYNYVTDSTQTNKYNIHDFIGAAYVNYTFRLKKINFMTGLRFENSYYDAKQTSLYSSANIGYNYPLTVSDVISKCLFPSAFISKKLSDKKELQFNASRKINRPDFRQIMPYIFSSDARNITTGNPALKPEMITLVELNYNEILNKGNILCSIFMRNTQHPITQHITPDPNDSLILITKPQNDKNLNTIGVDNILKYSFIKNFETTMSVNLFYTIINLAGTNDQISGFYYTGKLNMAYKFMKGFSLQVSGNYESPAVSPRGKTKQVYFADLGLSKEFGKKFTLVFAANDIFDTKGKGSYIRTDTYIQEYWSRRETRYFKLTATYKFGKTDLPVLKKKTALQRNEDSSGEY